MSKIYLVAGTRPNFMKIAPIIRALRADGRLKYSLIHTGQHYDYEMNLVFYEELDIPAPDVLMECGGGWHAQQSAKIMVSFEDRCVASPPDRVLVVGDVNSTAACARSLLRNSGSQLRVWRPASVAATCPAGGVQSVGHRRHHRLVLYYRAGQRCKPET